MMISLVRGRNYGGICRLSAVPTLVREGGVRLTPLNSECFSFFFFFFFFFLNQVGFFF